MTAKEDYIEYINSGECPCCFPVWKYSDISAFDVWAWQDELDAWGVYARREG